MFISFPADGVLLDDGTNSFRSKDGAAGAFTVLVVPVAVGVALPLDREVLGLLDDEVVVAVGVALSSDDPLLDDGT